MENYKIVQEKIKQAKLLGIKKLDLSSNSTNYRLKEIPIKIFDLKEIEELDLSGNDIEEIPTCLCKKGSPARLR